MSTQTTFRVRLLRAMRDEGFVKLAGAVLDVEPAAAHSLISAGRARLEDEADLGPLVDAMSALQTGKTNSAGPTA